MASFIRTVLGDISPEELGHTQTHEHLLIDLSRPLPADTPDDERALDEAELTLVNVFAARRAHTSEDSKLLSEDDAIEGMLEYVAAGGRSIVEATSIGLGRNPEGIARISRATGVNVIMGSAFYHRDFHPDWLDGWSEDQITELIVHDITVGVDETGLRSGIIGEVGLGWPHHEVETRVLRAAVAAQVQTGAPMIIHPGRDPRSPFVAMETVASLGGDPTRTIMSHVDRTLFGKDDVRRLADTGCYVEYDLFGQESSFYVPSPIDMPNDAMRIDYIVDLVERGFADHILVAQDICHKTNMSKYGGEGWGHLINNVLPIMRRKGLSDEQIRTITVDNPATALTFAPR